MVWFDMKNIIVSLVCGLFGAIAFTMFNNYLYARPIAVVNVNEIISSHLKEYGEKDFTDDERKKVIQSFSYALDQVMMRVSNEQRVTLLVSPAVISDVPDYTEYIKIEIERSMRYGK